MTSRSTYLFPSPSFFEGVGRLFDFGGALTLTGVGPANVQPSPSVSCLTAKDPG
jgi:hypothetical protein